ncbi:MAG TPA: phospholipase D-like domain-containing protein [Gemmatimonadales bacterium]|nr:phospholipase D-like domain-containing protein [Gemmatimonadales bacterium]
MSHPTRPIEAAINRAAGARPVPGNRVTVLVDGASAYEAMLSRIATARDWIHLENYIIRDDGVGRRFAEALSARAREGMAVRVLYDWLGCVNTSRRYWRDLRRAGVEVRCFNPPHLLQVFANLTRNHRKLLVTDGCCAITGGQCIGDEWIGDPAKGLAPWRDTGVEIAGPAATALDTAFETTWCASGGTLPTREHRPAVPEAGNAEVRVVVGEPGRERAYRTLEYLTAGSIERLWITDAYLVPPPRLFQALVDAAQDGADIRLLVPSTSDVAVVRNLTRIGYRRLLRAGIRIYEWDGPMLHAKTMVADGRWARIGTSNLNASSLLGNYEVDVLIEDVAFARDMEALFRRDLDQSLEVERRVRGTGRIQQVLPTGLHRRRSGPVPAPRSRAPRQLRGRAAVAARTLISAARRSVYGPLSLILVVLGTLFLFLPRTTAYAFGFVCVWFAVAAGVEAFRRREGGRVGPKDG